MRAGRATVWTFRTLPAVPSSKQVRTLPGHRWEFRHAALFSPSISLLCFRRHSLAVRWKGAMDSCGPELGRDAAWDPARDTGAPMGRLGNQVRVLPLRGGVYRGPS